MRVLISKGVDDTHWHFEQAFSDDDHSLALGELRKRVDVPGDQRVFKLQLTSDDAFEALIHENHLR